MATISLPIEQVGQPSSAMTSNGWSWQGLPRIVACRAGERAQVDDFCFYALASQSFRSFKRQTDADRIADTIVTSLPSRMMRALPMGKTWSSDRRHVECAAVQQLVFKENDRIFAADRGFQQIPWHRPRHMELMTIRPGTLAYHGA
jgi:hypothetical protein